MQRSLLTASAAFFVILGSVLLASRAEATPAPSYQGPTPYLSKAASPYGVGFFGFCVEDFEDGSFDIPGATGNGSVASPSGITDSVDADDGAIDGSGAGGHSYFYGDGAAGIEITFDPTRANGLPTQVGIVWTDGFGTTSFEAFGANGVSLGVQGPYDLADANYAAGTAEDRFFGITDYQGVSKIKISNTSGGIEVDHLQLNNCVLCGDANEDFHITASDALLALKAAVGTNQCAACVCDTNNNAALSAADALTILKKSIGLPVAMTCPGCNWG